MKIIDQYVEAVGKKLPLKGRIDIKKELKSLLLDEIESEYGESPTEEEVRSALVNFGSPAAVAERYAGASVPISPGLSDLYFLIIKIIPFAMAVAFTVIFILDVILDNLSGKELLRPLGTSLLSAVNGSVTGIGVVTIIFIILSRVMREKGKVPDDDWTPDELAGIEVEEESESLISTIIGTGFLLLLIILVWFAPELITLAENSFLKSGLPLGHRIDTEVFKGWSVFLIILWIGEIVAQGIQFRIGRRTEGLKIYGLCLSVLSIIVLGLMLGDGSLYINDTGYIGFKLIFIIVLVVSMAEFLGEAGKMVLKRIREKE